jgi:ornithine cyclodeaminase
VTEIVPREAEAQLDWPGLLAAFEAGHLLPKAEIKDLFLYRGADTVLDRAAWIDGLGALVKVATIHPGNAARGLPTVNGAVTLYDDLTGVLTAIVDFHLVTKWKTAGDSLLAASRLARKDSRDFLLVGAARWRGRWSRPIPACSPTPASRSGAAAAPAPRRWAWPWPMIWKRE